MAMVVIMYTRNRGLLMDYNCEIKMMQNNFYYNKK